MTLLHLVGNFAPDGGGRTAPVDLMLVPHFADGTKLRYVLDEADALGRLIDLRRVSGQFTGKVTPIVRKGADEVAGAPPTPRSPSRRSSRSSTCASCRRTSTPCASTASPTPTRSCARASSPSPRATTPASTSSSATTPPTDFALYSEVDVEGPDPNALGLLGYDNTPGKDVGNQRLFDRIGGVNATTQSDGFPGYGGIFAENFMGFSAHPSSRVARLDVDPTHFDAIFDAVRPDTGTPVSVAEVAPASPRSPTAAPASARAIARRRVACAVFVLGNLVGTTLTHEVGHSLGLADPDRRSVPRRRRRHRPSHGRRRRSPVRRARRAPRPGPRRLLR